MRRLKISAFAPLALLLGACQTMPTPVPVVFVPDTPAPVAPVAPVVEFETPTRLLPRFVEDTPAPATAVVAADTPSQPLPVVVADTPAPVAPMVAVETPTQPPPVVVADTPAPATPVVAADKPTRPLPVEPSTRPGPMVLSVGQSAQVGGGAGLRFEALERDSRCQPKVQCAWAGEVTLFFILQGESSTAGFELSSTSKPKATALGRMFELMAYGPCPAGTAGECATVTVAPAP